MADSFSKKDREKKKRKRKEEKAARREQKKNDEKKGNQIMYVDEFGNFTTTPPDPKQKSKVKLEDIEIAVPKKDEIEDDSPIRNGRVKFFNAEKGYGFIIDDATGESYFAHANNLVEEVFDNDRVVFEIGTGPKGPIALEVRLA